MQLSRPSASGFRVRLDGVPRSRPTTTGRPDACRELNFFQNVDQGSETQAIFALTHPDRRGVDDGHAIVMVQSSELQSGGAATTSVPEKSAKAAGLTVPSVWP